MPSRYPNMGHAAVVNLLVRLSHVTETFLKYRSKERIGFECAFPSYGNAGYLFRLQNRRKLYWL